VHESQHDPAKLSATRILLRANNSEVQAPTNGASPLVLIGFTCYHHMITSIDKWLIPPEVWESFVVFNIRNSVILLWQGGPASTES
jgi:hypothetical protein